jgi:RHS repeat-associated protein
VDDLDYMHARYYLPLIGRFTSVDPVLQAGRAQSSPQLWNRFSYALNSPLKYIDPRGRTLALPDDEEERRAALANLRNSVPVHLRIFVQATRGKSGNLVLDARLLNLKKGSTSDNFQALRQIANSPGTAFFSSSRSVVESKLGSELLSAEAGSLGITFPASQSLSGSIESYVAPSLTAFESATTTAHEIRHVRRLLLGLPYIDELGTRFTQTPVGDVLEIFLDPDGPVNLETGAAEAEARRNYDPFFPQNP